MSVTLTKGAVEALVNGSQVNNAVLQIINIRKVSADSGPLRYRLRLSDGLHTWSSFILATQLNTLTEDKLVPNSVFLVKKSVNNKLSDGRLVVILLDMEFLQSAEETGGKIGDPTPYEPVVGTSSSQSAPSTSVPASSPLASEPGPSNWNKSNVSSPGGREVVLCECHPRRHHP
ncbi:hypothetical protein PBY51_001696 [Eleginops maclovinus]|uniref:Replication factor-A protein 1 N-terminal domain-containing protein n=1 Tax=Eleginops maclovinus TaxID=56733 RepID=A0AAN7X0Z1_ELEMC|nr:hypothetical protein PBY51_001696 [Eleginops maclovinus]